MTLNDDDFPLSPAGPVTPELLWSGLVLLNERQQRISVSLTQHRSEFAEGMGDITKRLARLESRVTAIEATALTPELHSYLTTSFNRRQALHRSRTEITTHVLKQAAAVIAILILGALISHLGLGPNHFPHIGD